MGSQELPTIIDFVRIRASRGYDNGDADDRIGQLARQLGETIANAADADQWTVHIDTTDHGGYTFPLPSHRLLHSLHGAKRAATEVMLPLRARAREVGSVRLMTIRPQGFRQTDLDQARSVAECAGRLVALAIDRAADGGPCHPAGGGRARASLCLRFPAPSSWRGGPRRQRVS